MPGWTELPKPGNTGSVTTTTVTPSVHNSGKFRGVLGLTYTAGTITTTTTTTISLSWQEIPKPTNNF